MGVDKKALYLGNISTTCHHKRLVPDSPDWRDGQGSMDRRSDCHRHRLGTWVNIIYLPVSNHLWYRVKCRLASICVPAIFNIHGICYK